MTTQEIVNAAAALDTEQLRDVMHTLTLELASRRHTGTSVVTLSGEEAVPMSTSAY